MTGLAPGGRARGVLLLYHRPVLPWEHTRRASNVAENIAAFDRHSRFPVWGINTAYGFRAGLRKLSFDAIVVHYTVFVPRPEGYMLGEELLEYLAHTSAYKVAFFQDEHHHCVRRRAFIDECAIDCVYTLLEEPYSHQVYGERTRASKVISHLPSYVGPELINGAAQYGKPEAERRIDIGYRGRPSPAYWGREAREKSRIGERFAKLAADSELRLDIAVSEEQRLYDGDWHRFMADCVGTLGTESGVSCFDLEDEVLAEYQRLSAEGREPTIDELERGALGRWDGRIPYRTISPRNFEAAAFRVTQILFEGAYSGLMEPMRHYIPLRNDFSNLEEVLERFRDEALRRELTENAHDALIASGNHTYETLIAGFDAALIEAGLEPKPSVPARGRVRWRLRRRLGERWRHYEHTRLSWLYVHHERLWRLVANLLHPVKYIRPKIGNLMRRGG